MNSHCFNKDVIFCYNNLKKYYHEETEDYILVKQMKYDSIFIKNSQFDYIKLIQRKTQLYCEENIFDKAKVIKEYTYDLHNIFTNTTKEIRRGMNLLGRPEVTLKTECNLETKNFVYNEWLKYKDQQTTFFKIMFSPARYQRSYEILLTEFIYSIKDEPYAVINFSVNNNCAIELSYVSRFGNKDLKIVNDINELILTNSFHQLYLKGIKFANSGPDASIKGLRTLKCKLPHDFNLVYSKTIDPKRQNSLLI